MISKNQIKYVKGLSLKKNRIKEQCFVVEGEKCLAELLNSSFEIIKLFALKVWIDENKEIFDQVQLVSFDELGRISNLKSSNKVLAVVKMKKQEMIHPESAVTLVLDTINDPGNLGTIVRLCDWLGVKQIICSENTVDIYNPKVVQSAMGSLFRTHIIYTDLSMYLSKVTTPIYGAYMDGENVKDIEINGETHLVMGNEANGISEQIEKYIGKRVTIKRIGDNTESLNVAVATSILLHEFCN